MVPFLGFLFFWLFFSPHLLQLFRRALQLCFAAPEKLWGLQNFTQISVGMSMTIGWILIFGCTYSSGERANFKDFEEHNENECLN